MPSQVGITLGIVQALYYQSIALAKLNPTAFSARASHFSMTFLYSLASVEKVILFSCTVMSTMTSLAFLTLSV
jgi:hypothetical protein